LSRSYTVVPVVYLGTSADAVSSVCRLLDVLEEVWRSQDANAAWSVCCTVCLLACF